MADNGIAGRIRRGITTMFSGKPSKVTKKPGVSAMQIKSKLKAAKARRDAALKAAGG